MIAPNVLNALRWRLEVMAVRHGLWLVPAMLLLAASAAAWIWWLPAQEAALRAAQLALASEQQRVRQAPTHAVAAPSLPHSADGAAALEQLFALAAQHGLKVLQADYRRQQSGRAARWQVQLPATGTYPAVRRFVRAAKMIPGVSLDELGLHRAGKGGAVEARMLFSVWFAAGEGG